MNEDNFDLIYFSVEDALEPFCFSSCGEHSIPMAFGYVVTLQEEIDELEYKLAKLEAAGSGNGDADREDEDVDEDHLDDDDERLDTRCLIDMRYEEIDALIGIFCEAMPATSDALVALNAMLLSDDRLRLPPSHCDKVEPSDVAARMVERWLSQTAGCDPDTDFHDFRACVEYLVNLPNARRAAS